MIAARLKSIVLLLALVATPALSAAAPGARIDLTVHAVPLGTALTQLYSGTGIRVDIAPSLASAPVSADLHGVTLDTALRILLRISGQSGVARQSAGLLAISQLPAAGASAGSAGPTDTTTFGFMNGSISGFAAGPGGRIVPNQSFSSEQGNMRVPDARTTYVGGTTTGSVSSSAARVPFLPAGMRSHTRTGTSVNTFVTITVLPDPAPEHHGR